MAGTPAGFILSLLGVVLNKGRRDGALGLILTSILVLWFCFAALC
jgi:hypothetical protein